MLSCVIIAGSLWMSDGNRMVQPTMIHKEPNSDVVVAYTPTTSLGVRFNISEQHQLRMGTEEFLADCIHSGYSIDGSGWDDIDVNERTGIDD